MILAIEDERINNSAEFKDFCEALCNFSNTVVEIAMVAQYIGIADFVNKDLVEIDTKIIEEPLDPTFVNNINVSSILRPLTMLLNVQPLAITFRQHAYIYKDLHYKFTDRDRLFSRLKLFNPLRGNEKLLAETKYIIQGNAPAERAFEVYRPLLRYAQAFERCRAFKHKWAWEIMGTSKNRISRRSRWTCTGLSKTLMETLMLWYVIIRSRMHLLWQWLLGKRTVWTVSKSKDVSYWNTSNLNFSE